MSLNINSIVNNVTNTVNNVTYTVKNVTYTVNDITYACKWRHKRTVNKSLPIATGYHLISVNNDYTCEYPAKQQHEYIDI